MSVKSKRTPIPRQIDVTERAMVSFLNVETCGGWCQSLCRFANCDTRVLKPTFWSQSFMGLTLRHRGLRISLRISAPRSPAVTTLLLTRTIRLRRDRPEADRANIVRWSRATQQGRQNRAPRRRSNETAIALATGLPHATFARGGTRGARLQTAKVGCQVSLTVSSDDHSKKRALGTTTPQTTQFRFDTITHSEAKGEGYHL